MRLLRRPKKTWFDESSPFVEELRARLPGVEVEPFLWSGDNSYLERHVAAERLAYRLMKYDDADNSAQQIVVAHSHGGSVALLASMHPWAPPLAGIATMATPFLNIEQRTADTLKNMLLGAIQIVTVLLLLAWTIVTLFALLDVLGVLSSSDTRGSASWPFANMGPVSVVLSFALPLCAGSMLQRLTTLRRAVSNTRSWAPKRIAPWLILRAPRDEASLVLAGARAAYKAFEFTWQPLRVMVAFIAPALKHGWPLMLLLLIVSLFWTPAVLRTFTRILVLGESWLVAWRHAVPNPGLFDQGAPFALALLVTILVLGGLLLFAGSLLSPFGWEFLVMGLAFEIKGQTTPPGDAYNVQEVLPTWRGLRHFLYNSPEARTLLIRWIEQLPPAAAGPGSRYWKIVT